MEGLQDPAGETKPLNKTGTEVNTASAKVRKCFKLNFFIVL